MVRLWRRPASACKPYRIKSNQNSQFLRAGESVGLAVPDRFKCDSFSKFNCLQICRIRFAQKSARDAIECRLSISRFDLPMTRTPLPHAASVRGPCVIRYPRSFITTLLFFISNSQRRSKDVHGYEFEMSGINFFTFCSRSVAHFADVNPQVNLFHLPR